MNLYCYCQKSNDKAFHSGKWYRIEDYRIIDEDEIPRPCMIKKGEQPIKDLSDIRNFKDGNWSWIGEFTEIKDF